MKGKDHESISLTLSLEVAGTTGSSFHRHRGKAEESSGLKGF